MRAGEILGLADVLRGLGDLAERGQHAAGGEPAERGGQRDPARAQQRQDPAQVGQDRVDAVERPRELDRDRLRHAVDGGREPGT